MEGRGTGKLRGKGGGWRACVDEPNFMASDLLGSCLATETLLTSPHPRVWSKCRWFSLLPTFSWCFVRFSFVYSARFTVRCVVAGWSDVTGIGGKS